MTPTESREAGLLRSHKTLVVVGLSSDPARTSHRVAAYMQQHGYRIVPVNPNETEVLGERCYPSLMDVPGPVEFVDVFRRADACPEVAREAAARGAGVLWLQLGIVSPEARQIAEAAGIDYVEDACVMAVHRGEIAT
jgi:predicted CoA-binding protein